jgi:hypothetical protein
MTFQESSNKDSIDGKMNDDNETCPIMNVDANMDDLKDYVGTSNILES